MRDRVDLLLISAVVLGLSSAHAQTSRNPAEDKRFARPSSQTLLSVKNDLVAVQVRTTNDTSVSGEITYAGAFNIGTASNLPLLFKFPEAPFSSHVNIRVDNTFYSSDPRRTNCNLLRLTSARVVGDSALECSYQAGPIAVLQRLSPQKFSATTGAILIEYVLLNNDPTNNHQTGALLELDTFVNGNDQAPVLTNFGYSRFERKYTAPQIPVFFQAFQFGNPADSTGLVAQGNLAGYNAVRPDQLIIGDWSRLSSVQWDYDVPGNPPPYDDSAVILRWNEQNLAASQTRTIATYYGLGDVSTRRDAASGLTLHLIALRNLRAVNGQLSPNPFEVNLLVFNRTNPAVNAVQATLILPPQLALASGDFSTKLLAPSNLSIAQNNGTASWAIVAQCPATALEVLIRVEVSGLVGTNSVFAPVERALFLPSCAETQPAFRIVVQPDSISVRQNEHATLQVSLQPLLGFNQPVELSVWPPATPGITTSLMPLHVTTVQQATLTVRAEQSALPGQYLYLINGKGGGLIGSAGVTVQVLSADFAPPYAVNFNPPRGAREVPLRSGVSLEVLDDDAGVDSAALSLLVNGVRVSPQAVRINNGYHVHYLPSVSWRDHQRVMVQLQAQDLAAPPNVFSDEYFFTTVRDSLPPFVASRHPEAGATNVTADAEITVTVVDLQSGVDQQSLMMEINGQRVLPLVLGDQRAANLKYKPASPWLHDSTVRVAVRAQDLATPPNVMAADTFRFVIAPPRPDLIAGDLHAAESFILGRSTRLQGRIQAVNGEVSQSFRVEFRADGESRGDTTITALVSPHELEIGTRLRFDTPGTHIVEMVVDPDDAVFESDENNNRRQLVVNINETLANKLTVRPNPFTPNQDGYNDVVEFNFAGMDLDSPTLHVFDVNGVPVWMNAPHAGKIYTWDGRDENGRELQPGVYLYTLRDHGANVASGLVVIAR
ncbi:MAG: gliding motility-associated C-terminal domain-containing protein [bacterium]